MKRLTWCVVLMALPAASLSALEAQPASVSITVRPYLSVPFGFPALAFSSCGGGEIIVEYGLAGPFRVDAGVGYQLAPFSGEAEVLHLISVRAGAGAQWQLLPRLAAGIFARAGVYTSISSDRQETVGVHVSAVCGIGAAVSLTPRVSIVVDGAYSLYVRKYQGINVYAGVAIAVGPDGRRRVA